MSKVRISRISTASKAVLGRWTLSCLRWVLILVGFWFVVSGWVQSAAKYASGKTSVSFEVNQTDKFLFPSLTICPDSKSSIWLGFHRMELEDKAETRLNQKDIFEVIKRSTYAREDFMVSFRPPSDQEKIADNDAIRGNPWKSSIPNLSEAGTCYTFDPLEVSTSGTNSGVIFVLKVPENLTVSSDKNQWLSDTDVFLHDRGEFFYGNWGNEQPSSVRIELTRLRMGLINSITIGYSRFTALDKEGEACSSSDNNYSFAECFEKEFARRRGCQKPWLHFPELDLAKCDNVSVIVNILDEERQQAGWSAIRRAKESNCPQPCTSSVYRLDYSYIAQAFPTYTPSDNLVIVCMYFENFKFQYGEEYAMCDWTCLIGEIGGNIGFILGSSILTLYDMVHYRLISKLS